MSFAPVRPLIALLLASACAAPQTARNIEPEVTGRSYQSQYRDIRAANDPRHTLVAPAINAETCRTGGDVLDVSGAVGGKYGGLPNALQGELLSRGDLVNLRLPGDDTFSGDYVISRDGLLKLPFLAPIPAEGRATEAVAEDIRNQLVADGYYEGRFAMSFLLLDFAPVRVGVSGAVFEPHPVDIGGVRGDQVDGMRQGALGASTEGRNLSQAIRSAGGVRPDADLSAVRLTRAGRNHVLDLRGMLTGTALQDPMLIAGDEIYVPTRDCFQDDLMKPSPISPPGISLYLSNLTQPATDNASSAIGQSVREVPYGTRFMQAVVDANCVGGARATSASRSAALFSRNPVTGVSIVIERDVETMRIRADRDDYDPYLLPGDAIACYDSGVTNLAEIARVVGMVGAVAFLP